MYVVLLPLSTRESLFVPTAFLKFVRSPLLQVILFNAPYSSGIWNLMIFLLPRDFLQNY